MVNHELAPLTGTATFGLSLHSYVRLGGLGLTPEFSGRAPSHGDVHFIVHGRCNEMLEGSCGKHKWPTVDFMVVGVRRLHRAEMLHEEATFSRAMRNV